MDSDDQVSLDKLEYYKKEMEKEKKGAKEEEEKKSAKEEEEKKSANIVKND